MSSLFTACQLKCLLAHVIPQPRELSVNFPANYPKVAKENFPENSTNAFARTSMANESAIGKASSPKMLFSKRKNQMNSQI